MSNTMCKNILVELYHFLVGFVFIIEFIQLFYIPTEFLLPPPLPFPPPPSSTPPTNVSSVSVQKIYTFKNHDRHSCEYY